MKKYTAILFILTVMHARAQSFDWMTGTWVATLKQNMTYYESWKKDSTGGYTGAAVTMYRGDTAEYEKTRICMNNGTYAYYVSVNGRTEVMFNYTGTDSSGASVFENKEHDFPQRIYYRLQEKGKLYARVEGMPKGRFRKIEFFFKAL